MSQTGPCDTRARSSAQTPSEYASASVRLLVVDDDPGIRRLVCALSARDPGVAVVAEAGDGAEAIEAVVTHRPDVVLLDIDMPVMDGISAIGPMLEAAPSTRLVAFSAVERREACLDAGVHSFVQKGASWTEIREALLTDL